VVLELGRPPTLAPERMKEEPYSDYIRPLRQSDSSPQTIESKKDDGKLKDGRPESTADDTLRKLGPSRDWTAMPHAPERKNKILLDLPRLM